MRGVFVIIFICCCSLIATAQTIFGFRHLQTIFQGDTVNILIKSKKDDELKRKPLFLFCQGSLPVPLIVKYDDNGKKRIFNVFVFNTDSLSEDYHLAIISKPSVPLIAEQKALNEDLSYQDQTGKFPKAYIDNNYLDYYVDRNISVIQFLQKQTWVSTDRLVVAGHSEGSTIAAKMASSFKGVTDLIYSGGNPLGRILTMIEQSRAVETDSSSNVEQVFLNWQAAIDQPDNLDAGMGDTNKAISQFSIPPMKYLEQLKIPVLITYGTKDFCSPYLDYFRVEMMRQRKLNFTFKSYVGLQHNFFPLKEDGEINYDVFNWDKVAGDWARWLRVR